MMAVLSTVDLESVEQEVKDSQSAVERLLDNEDRTLSRLEEIVAIADQSERLEEAAKLIVECEALIAYAKEMSAAITRAKKRMDGVVVKVKGGVHEEVEAAGGMVETKNWKLTIRDNPVSVVVDELAEVPRKYKMEPGPPPPVEEWPVDKNMVKKALTKERVQSIKGVHLEQKSRVEVKPR